MKHALHTWLKLFVLPALFVAGHTHAAQSQFLPQRSLYPIYFADPMRPTFSAQRQYYSYSGIVDSGNDRFDLKLGATLPLYRTNWRKQPWQWALFGGFHGQFDNRHSQDNIGWDGIYGLSLTTRPSPQLAWRIGLKHISAHIGDELIQRTGRSRIGYTRQELRAGLAWSPLTSTTLYAETGYAYDLRNSVLQRPWRLQLGAQYHRSFTYRQLPLQWYSALDLSAYQENDWDMNTCLQVGIAMRSGFHHWRLGTEFYNGRSQLGEFFQDRERYAGIGLWFDF